jgi:hypothetical protein
LNRRPASGSQLPAHCATDEPLTGYSVQRDPFRWHWQALL